MNQRPKVYIAGPECFMPDATQRAASAINLCEQYGFEGWSPAAGTSPDGAPVVHFDSSDRASVAREICFKNRWLIEHCDLIIANANNFRGEEPDGGTSFELGYGYALGKKLYVFLDDTRPCVDKYKGVKIADEQGTLRDEEGRFFESGCLNLMLSAPATVVQGDFEAAIQVAAQDFFGKEIE